MCSGCGCPWRVCTACTIQRAAASDIRDIDPATGLCKFHTKHGIATFRPEGYDKEEILLPSISIADPLVEEALRAEVPQPGNTSVPTLPEGEDAALMDEFAATARHRFNERRMLIMRYLAEGIGRGEIAERLGTKKGTVIATINNMGFILDLPAYEDHGSKTQYVGSYLARLYRYMQASRAEMREDDAA
jgi:DNA-binding CsgD family transcriptional regulator